MPNDSLLTLIKKAALDAVTASKPCNTMTGKVQSISPLKIAVGQKMVLDKDFLSVTTAARRHMEIGSRVLLIRQAGGQRFTIVDTLD